MVHLQKFLFFSLDGYTWKIHEWLSKNDVTIFVLFLKCFPLSKNEISHRAGEGNIRPAGHIWHSIFWWHLNMTKYVNVCFFFYKLKSLNCLATHVDVTRDTLFENHCHRACHVSVKNHQVSKINFSYSLFDFRLSVVAEKGNFEHLPIVLDRFQRQFWNPQCKGHPTIFFLDQVYHFKRSL